MQLIHGLHFNNLRGDFYGGVVAAIVALPPRFGIWRGFWSRGHCWSLRRYFCRFFCSLVWRHPGPGLWTHRPYDYRHGRYSDPIQRRTSPRVYCSDLGRGHSNSVRTLRSRKVYYASTLPSHFRIHERDRVYHYYFTSWSHPRSGCRIGRPLESQGYSRISGNVFTPSRIRWVVNVGDRKFDTTQNRETHSSSAFGSCYRDTPHIFLFPRHTTHW